MTVVSTSLRNVAIVAHVDHGKTTLVDALLRQTGALDNLHVDRALDSMDLEREKGITILAKNAAVRYGDVKLNIVDTPGHADFGGEVERALAMVDGVLLLVDATEGPLPQTRFVVRKTLQRRLPVVLVVTKVDRSYARTAEVVDEVYELFLDLDADETQIDFPILYCDARAGHASRDRDVRGADLTPLLDAIVGTVPPPAYEPDAPLRAIVANLDATPYLGRVGICRVHSGTVRRGQQVAWCRDGDHVESVRLTEVFVTEGLDRVATTEAGPGEIVAVAGIADVLIGDTLADPDDPRPLPRIVVDEPALSITLGVNTSPLAGRDGNHLTARQIKSRLDAELVGNVSLLVLPSDRPDTWEVQGRGELQLAVLVETLLREGFELTVGKPRVVTRRVGKTVHEPVERLSIDVPEECLGTVTQLLAARKGRLQQMTNHGTGWVRLEYLEPARGLVGLRTEFLTATRGAGVLHHVFEAYEPWHGELRTRSTGALVADRGGVATSYALLGLQERGDLFVEPGTEVYEGMIVGESTRPEDLDVNVTREKRLTNMRSSTSEELVRLAPHRRLSLEQALEFCREDECTEVTPAVVRLRKVTLAQGKRFTENRAAMRLR